MTVRVYRNGPTRKQLALLKDAQARPGEMMGNHSPQVIAACYRRCWIKTEGVFGHFREAHWRLTGHGEDALREHQEGKG